MKTKKKYCIDFKDDVLIQLYLAKCQIETVLMVWNSLGIGPAGNITDIILEPEAEYKKAIDNLKISSAGNPYALVGSSNVARTIPFCLTTGLWDIKNDKVEMNPSKVASIMKSIRSILT